MLSYVQSQNIVRNENADLTSWVKSAAENSRLVQIYTRTAYELGKRNTVVKALSVDLAISTNEGAQPNSIEASASTTVKSATLDLEEAEALSRALQILFTNAPSRASQALKNWARFTTRDGLSVGFSQVQGQNPSFYIAIENEPEEENQSSGELELTFTSAGDLLKLKALIDRGLELLRKQ